MCNAKMPAAPPAPAAAPATPIQMARIVRPSPVRQKRREVASGGGAQDVLSSLRIPLQIPGTPEAPKQ